MEDPEIRIDWLRAAAAPDSWLAEAESWLDAAERARLARFLVAHAARDYLLGRWLARRALSARTGIPEPAWRFELGQHGRPAPIAVGGVAVPDLNISHGGGLVVVASSARLRVGVDVEAVDRSLPVDRLDRFLTEVEQAAVLGGPDAERAERFLRIWTLKEAVLKAMGTGIAGTLAAASIELDPCAGSAPVCAEAGWFLAEFRPTPQHRLAVAARAEGAPPRIELCGIGGD